MMKIQDLLIIFRKNVMRNILLFIIIIIIICLIYGVSQFVQEGIGKKGVSCEKRFGKIRNPRRRANRMRKCKKQRDDEEDAVADDAVADDADDAYNVMGQTPTTPDDTRSQTVRTDDKNNAYFAHSRGYKRVANSYCGPAKDRNNRDGYHDWASNNLWAKYKHINLKQALSKCSWNPACKGVTEKRWRPHPETNSSGKDTKNYMLKGNQRDGFLTALQPHPVERLDDDDPKHRYACYTHKGRWKP